MSNDRARTLKHYSNNAYQTILLCENGTPLSAWTTPNAVRDMYEAVVNDDDLSYWAANHDDWKPSDVDELISEYDGDTLIVHTSIDKFASLLSLAGVGEKLTNALLASQ